MGFFGNIISKLKKSVDNENNEEKLEDVKKEVENEMLNVEEVENNFLNEKILECIKPLEETKFYNIVYKDLKTYVVNNKSVNSKDINDILDRKPLSVIEYETKSGTFNQMKEYKEVLTDMINMPKAKSNVTYDTFDIQAVVNVAQSYLKNKDILKEIADSVEMSDSMKEIEELKKNVVDMGLKISKFIPIYKEFKTNETGLREEILSFSNAVKKMQNQNTVNPDWGGKKGAYEKKAEDLKQKRTLYEKDEKKFDVEIINMCKLVVSTGEKFDFVAKTILEDIKSKEVVKDFEDFKNEKELLGKVKKEVANLAYDGISLEGLLN